MDEQQALSYVRAAAVALGLPIDEARVARVAVQLRRTAALAESLDAWALDAADELVEIYRPLPFPAESDAGGAPP
jgi:hypothetical protein